MTCMPSRAKHAKPRINERQLRAKFIVMRSASENVGASEDGP
jgi:hypothetical protein